MRGERGGRFTLSAEDPHHTPCAVEVLVETPTLGSFVMLRDPTLLVSFPVHRLQHPTLIVSSENAPPKASSFLYLVFSPLLSRLPPPLLPPRLSSLPRWSALLPSLSPLLTSPLLLPIPSAPSRGHSHSLGLLPSPALPPSASLLAPMVSETD